MRLTSAFFMLLLLAGVHGGNDTDVNDELQKELQDIDNYLSKLMNITLLSSMYRCPGPRGIPETRNTSVQCLINDTVADCSGHVDPPLTYVPALPPEVTQLIFSDNGLKKIESGFFANVTGITHLDLSYNKLERISDDAFLPLNDLRVLDLTRNNLTDLIWAPLLKIRTLQVLVLYVNRIAALPDGQFLKDSTPYLEVLCLSWNSFYTLDMKALRSHEKLQQIELAKNGIHTLKTVYLPELVYLGLIMNSLTQFPKTCDESQGSFFPKLITINLGANGIGSIPSEVCLPSLQNLHIHENLISTIHTGAFETRLFPSLKVINLHSMQEGFKVIEKGAFANSMLTGVDMQKNYVDFSAPAMHPDMFEGCPNLRMLALTDNDFSKASQEKVSGLLGNITSLYVIDLGRSNLGEISPETFKHLHQMMALSLSANRLTQIPAGTFGTMTDLLSIDLSNNLLAVVGEAVFSPSSMPNLRVIQLQDNPFSCACELRWFRNWLKTTHIIRDGPYMCANMPDTRVEDFHVADQACLLDPENTKIIIVVVVMILCTFITTTLLYRYRWHIRLVLYEAFRGRAERWRRPQERHFRYDAFISYDKNDLDWVRAHLMPELEEGLGLRLCIHERDFVIGQHIVDNIAESVKTSKKVIMVFSSNFARSPWCQFELNFCLGHVLENNDMLLVVLLPDLESRDLTPAMMAVMKTTTYIDWGDEAEARDSFWRRMHIALDEILPAV